MLLSLSACAGENSDNKSADITNTESTGNSESKKTEKEIKQDISLLESGYSIKDDGTGYINANYGVTVSNPNKEYIATFPEISVTAKDESGAIIGTDSMIIPDIASQDTVSFGGSVNCNGKVPASIDIAAVCSDLIPQGSNTIIRSSDLSIVNTSEIPTEFYTTYTGEVENVSKKEVEDLMVTLILKNNGKIVYGNTTHVSDLSPGAKKPFQIMADNIDHTEFIISAQSY